MEDNETVSVRQAPSPSSSVVVVRCAKTSRRGDSGTTGGCAGEKQFEGFQLGDDLEEIALRLFYSWKVNSKRKAEVLIYSTRNSSQASAVCTFLGTRTCRCMKSSSEKLVFKPKISRLYFN